MNERQWSARKYIGGHFEEAGKMQLDFLIEEGLKPEHVLLDVGCGNCRAGRYFIRYLNEGNYWGLDHQQWLVDAALEFELTEEDKKKNPRFIVNNDFDFCKMDGVKPNFVIAKSVFTHLTRDEIILCLKNVKAVIHPKGVFYASITIGESSDNPKKSDDTRVFRYTLDEIKSFAKGWEVEALGQKGTYKQVMLKFYVK